MACGPSAEECSTELLSMAFGHGHETLGGVYDISHARMLVPVWVRSLIVVWGS